MVSEPRPTDEPTEISSYLYDDCTGLPYRAIFEDRLRHARQRAERRSEVFAVVLLEFAAPEDFSAGVRTEESLRELLASRVTEPLRISDTVAVFGPTQLAIILEDVSNEIGAQVAVARMMEIGRVPSIVDGQSFTPIVKAGIGVSAPPHITAEVLLEQAEKALDRSYERGGSNFVTYNPHY